MYLVTLHCFPLVPNPAHCRGRDSRKKKKKKEKKRKKIKTKKRTLDILKKKKKIELLLPPPGSPGASTNRWLGFNTDLSTARNWSALTCPLLDRSDRAHIRIANRRASIDDLPVTSSVSLEPHGHTRGKAPRKDPVQAWASIFPSPNRDCVAAVGHARP
jgi:hypothetical protein